MKIRFVSVLMLLVCLFLPGSVVAQGTISNPDFEEDSGWVFFDNGDYWVGEYSSFWASHGFRSYLIHIPPEGSLCENYPGANTYGEISQSVDLTGVDGILFDFRTFGTWDIPLFSPDYYESAEVWVDAIEVYHKEREVGDFYNQIIPVSGFIGTHKLTFRMQFHEDFCSSFNDKGMYIDNLRLVSHFVFLPIINK